MGDEISCPHSYIHVAIRGILAEEREKGASCGTAPHEFTEDTEDQPVVDGQ